MTSTRAIALSLSLVVSACSGDSNDHSAPAGMHVHADGTVHQDEPVAGTAEPGHVRPDRIALGEVKVGSHTISVFQVAKIEPGQEGDFDLDFATGTTLPAAVRGWIGDESSIGSMRVRFQAETATRLHGHPEVPKPLADGSLLWIEIEGIDGPQKGSIAFRK